MSITYRLFPITILYHFVPQTMRNGLEQLTSYAQGCMREILLFVFSKQSPLGGVCFDLPDEAFDAQPALSLLPKSLITPFEAIVNICTSTLGENNKDMVVGLLADACCERVEQFITQVCISTKIQILITLSLLIVAMNSQTLDLLEH